MEGWIKLYRKFDEWEWFTIPEMVSLFIYLLLNANNTDGEWRGVKVKRGQIITGRKTLHEKTKISEQTLRTCLKRLENTKEITIQSTNHFSIITICKYNDYQPLMLNTNQPINQPLTSNQPATNHKQEGEEGKDNTKTWRNDFSIYMKECKEGYKEVMEDSELIRTQQRLNPGINIGLSIEKGFTNFWGTEAGWNHKKSKKSKAIDWRSTIINSIDKNKVYYTKQELALHQ